MLQRRIGDRSVGAIALGGAGLSLGSRLDDAGAERVIDAALAAGVSYLDTAAAYATLTDDSHNERLIARVLRRYGSNDVFVGTKGGHFRRGNEWPVDGRPESIRADCERSLRALEVDSIDLYYLHKPDPRVPFEVSVGALEDLRLEGKVVRTGISNVSETQLASALRITPLVAVQNAFSPFQRGDEGLIANCAELGIAYVMYSPLGGASRPSPLEERLPLTAALAAARGSSLESIVLAWELSLAPTVITIVGATRPATIIDSAGAPAILMDPELLASISEDLAT